MSIFGKAVASMKYNKSLRKKHRKKTEALSGDNSGKTELDFPKASKFQVEKLKQELEKEHKQTRIKQIIVLTIVMIVLVSVFVYLA